MAVDQREIVEIPFVMPDGEVLPHPALVISHDDLQYLEPGMFYALLVSSKNHYPEVTIPIQPEWLSRPMQKDSYFVTHLLGMYKESEIIKRTNTFLKQRYFDYVVNRIIDVVIDGKW